MKLSASLKETIQQDLAAFARTQRHNFQKKPAIASGKTKALLTAQLEAERERARQNSAFYDYTRHMRILAQLETLSHES